MISFDDLQNELKDSKLTFVETIPSGCQFPSEKKLYKSIGKSIIKLLKKAEKSVKAISFYFTLRGKDVNDITYPTANIGEEVYNQLEEAAKRGVKIYLLANKKGRGMDDYDMSDLQTMYPTHVNVGFIDMTHKTEGYIGGICHTKLWIIDDKYFYVGSANMDWRAYTEIVETGIVGKKCYTIINKLNEIFLKHWDLAMENDTRTKVMNELYNICTCGSTSICLNVVPVRISSSPDLISNATKTENDIYSLLETINTAENHLYLTTYQYATHDYFSKPAIIDLRVEKALIEAATQRNVDVRIIIDINCVKNKSSRKSLSTLSNVKGIFVKTFQLEQKTPPEIPFARLWHSKLAVSESKLWISTNNIEPSYFYLTCGIGILFDSTVASQKEPIIKLVECANDHFIRYWNSNYVKPFEQYTITE